MPISKPKAYFSEFLTRKERHYPQDFDWDCEMIYNKVPLSVFNQLMKKVPNAHLAVFNKVLHIIALDRYHAKGIYMHDDYTYVVIIKAEIPSFLYKYKISRDKITQSSKIID